MWCKLQKIEGTTYHPHTRIKPQKHLQHTPRETLWKDHRTFLDHIAKKLNITDQAGWYNKIKTMHILQEKGGSGMLSKYNRSIVKLLSTIYSEYLVLYVILSFITLHDVQDINGTSPNSNIFATFGTNIPTSDPLWTIWPSNLISPIKKIGTISLYGKNMQQVSFVNITLLKNY